MEQTRALNALEPFLALASSASTPRQAADLITRATSAPNTYLFTELLETPQIQSLASSSEYAPHLTLLSIFSHGTYTTYLTTPNLPALTAQQTLKLRQLTLLTLAKDRVLTYSSLTSQLNLANAVQLEELVTSAIYAGLIDSTLDPAHSTVHIHSVAPLRDAAAAAVPDLLSSLQSWASRCDAALSDLQSRVRSVRTQADARARRQAEWDARVAKLVDDESKAGPGQFAGAAAAGESAAGGAYGHGPGYGQGYGLPARHQPGPGQSRGARYGKRGSGHMDEAEEDEDDEAMDLDEEDDVVGGTKRSMRRKLLG